jgi:hypothetical protein
MILELIGDERNGGETGRLVKQLSIEVADPAAASQISSNLPPATSGSPFSSAPILPWHVADADFGVTYTDIRISIDISNPGSKNDRREKHYRQRVLSDHSHHSIALFLAAAHLRSEIRFRRNSEAWSHSAAAVRPGISTRSAL